jgi:hypothetical protein
MINEVVVARQMGCRFLEDEEKMVA